MAGQNIYKSLQQDWFLAIDRASANNNRAGVGLLERCTQTSDDRRRNWCRHVKLKVAGYMDAFSGRPNCPKSASIFAGLRQEEIHVSQNSGQKTPDSTVSRKR